MFRSTERFMLRFTRGFTLSLLKSNPKEKKFKVRETYSRPAYKSALTTHLHLIKLVMLSTLNVDKMVSLAQTNVPLEATLFKNNVLKCKPKASESPHKAIIDIRELIRAHPSPYTVVYKRCDIGTLITC